MYFTNFYPTILSIKTIKCKTITYNPNTTAKPYPKSFIISIFKYTGIYELNLMYLCPEIKQAQR